jgi:hypothetical protein
VNAGVVFALLINPQPRIESLHQIRIAVALAAIGWDVERLRFSQISFARILGRFFCVGIRIATMTIVTRQSARFVNVGVESFRRRAEARIFKLDVAFDTGRLGLSNRGGKKDERDNQIGQMRQMGQI